MRSWPIARSGFRDSLVQEPVEHADGVVYSGRNRPQDSNGQCDPMPSDWRS